MSAGTSVKSDALGASVTCIGATPGPSLTETSPTMRMGGGQTTMAETMSKSQSHPMASPLHHALHVPAHWRPHNTDEAADVLGTSLHGAKMFVGIVRASPPSATAPPAAASTASTASTTPSSSTAPTASLTFSYAAGGKWRHASQISPRSDFRHADALLLSRDRLDSVPILHAYLPTEQHSFFID
ncbi:hypothetical protein Q4I28_006720 [Leishmania naiffi]|uniref:Uncharacterized protein n=1 Tax=Leishmania naiffi TaxID=5678 RepID=A0AAW3BC98_9TRYP